MPRASKRRFTLDEIRGVLEATSPEWNRRCAELKGSTPEEQLAELDTAEFLETARELLAMAKHAQQQREPMSSLDLVIAAALSRDLCSVVLEVDRRRPASNHPVRSADRSTVS